MRLLFVVVLLQLLAQALPFSVDAHQIEGQREKLDLQLEAEHDLDYSALEKHLLSVLLLLNGQSSEQLQKGSTDAIDLVTEVKAVDNFVSLLLTARTNLGVNNVHELKDPSAAHLITALSKRIPTEKQEASKYLRIILTDVHKLLGRSSVGYDSESRGDTGRIISEEDEERKAHSYPLLRRVTVARLIQVWFLHLRLGGASVAQYASGSQTKPSPWEIAGRRDVGRVLLVLFRLHRAGMRARFALEFLHISKAAGTSMCHLAEVSGCRAQDFSMGRTCLMRDFDDQPRWINGTHHWKRIARVAEPLGAHPYAFLLYGVPRLPNRKRTCPARLGLLSKHRLNFFANEYTVYNNLTMYEPPHQDEGDEVEDVDDAGKKPAYLFIPPSPPSPPLLRPPPAPPQAVIFEETAARYASFVSELVATAPKARDSGRSVRGRSNRGRSLRSSSRARYSIMEGAELCPYFANVIVLREPAQRFMSHLKFIAQTYATKYTWPSVAHAFAPGRSSGSWWRAFAPPLFDNYMLRTLAGEAVFSMPYSSLEAGAASYMQLAKTMLAQYDVILVLEAEEASHRLAVNFGLAWRHLLTEFQLRNASSLLKKLKDMQISAAQLAALLPGETLLAKLKPSALRYDNQLYAFGVALAGLDDVVWRVASEALGEPLPGFRSNTETQCGYIRTPERPPGPPSKPPAVPSR